MTPLLLRPHSASMSRSSADTKNRTKRLGPERLLTAERDYSHSMVAGGFEEMS